jgi:tetratricopeptide (TPR) repeat protein
VRDHGQCLTDETLTEYLQGGLDPPIQAASEVHLVACADCRNQLAFFMRVLESDVSAEEAKTLETIVGKWNTEHGTPAPSPRTFTFRRSVVALGVAAAAIIVVVMAGWIVRLRSAEPKSANEVVELLLAQNRPFESRIAGEPHRPIVRTRGSEEPGVSYGLLAGEMGRLSATSSEMGRFYLLQKDFTRAISHLEAAEREGSAGPAVHNDLGVAYLEGGSGTQLEKAKEEFQHAMQEDQSFAPASFNLALLYERKNQTGLAEAQWKRYLELDSKSDWATEARERLQGLSR